MNKVLALAPTVLALLLCESTPAHAKLLAKEVTYDGGGVRMKGYIAYDDARSGKRPGVLVVHEWWGHNEYARRRARMLAQLGYTALAVDMYGNGKQAGHPADAQKFAGEVMSNMKAAEARFRAAMAVLRQHPTTAPDKLAAIGYCFGGAVVLHMARIGTDLRGVASFHGTLGSKMSAKRGQVRAELLVLHGGEDPFVPAEQVAAFTQEMIKAGAKLELVVYPGAKHAFTNPEASRLGQRFKLPLAYDAKADKQSWSALERFLAQLFAS